MAAVMDVCRRWASRSVCCQLPSSATKEEEEDAAAAACAEGEVADLEAEEEVGGEVGATRSSHLQCGMACTQREDTQSHDKLEGSLHAALRLTSLLTSISTKSISKCGRLLHADHKACRIENGHKCEWEALTYLNAATLCADGSGPRPAELPEGTEAGADGGGGREVEALGAAPDVLGRGGAAVATGRFGKATGATGLSSSPSASVASFRNELAVLFKNDHVEVLRGGAAAAAAGRLAAAGPVLGPEPAARGMARPGPCIVLQHSPVRQWASRTSQRAAQVKPMNLQHFELPPLVRTGGVVT